MSIASNEWRAYVLGIKIRRATIYAVATWLLVAGCSQNENKLTIAEQVECDYVISLMKLNEPDFICECTRGEYGINKYCYNPKYVSEGKQ